MLKRIKYSDLNSRQKENYIFAKVSAVLADYGFTCIRLSDDYQGADFIALHADGEQVLKVQLKGRLAIEQRYIGKNIWVAFPHKGRWFMFPHDEAADALIGGGDRGGFFSSGYLSAKQLKF